MAGFIEAHHGKVLLGTRVEKILTKDGAAYGVTTADKQVYKGRVVVSNADAWDTFHGIGGLERRCLGYVPRYVGTHRRSRQSEGECTALRGQRKEQGKDGYHGARLGHLQQLPPEGCGRRRPGKAECPERYGTGEQKERG